MKIDLKTSLEALNNFCLKNPVKSGFIFFTLFFTLLYSVVIFFHLDTLSSVLDNHWQTADIEALKTDPIAALLHLHSQPPLFNFFVFLKYNLSTYTRLLK